MRARRRSRSRRRAPIGARGARPRTQRAQELLARAEGCAEEARRRLQQALEVEAYAAEEHATAAALVVQAEAYYVACGGARSICAQAEQPSSWDQHAAAQHAAAGTDVAQLLAAVEAVQGAAVPPKGR